MKVVSAIFQRASTLPMPSNLLPTGRRGGLQRFSPVDNSGFGAGRPRCKSTPGLQVANAAAAEFSSVYNYLLPGFMNAKYFLHY